MPLRRSLVFWMGLLVNLFLVWAWVDSMSWNSYWHRGSWDFVRVSNRRGAVEFQQLAYIDKAWSAAPGTKVNVVWARDRLGPAEFGEWFPWIGDAPEINNGWRHTLWRLPYWLLLSLVLLLWLPLLFWRARRISRAWRAGIPVA